MLKVSVPNAGPTMCCAVIAVALTCGFCVDAHAVADGIREGAHWDAQTYLRQTSLLIALGTVANRSAVSAACRKQLQRVERAALHKQPWAMMLIDASATKASGFMFGHNFWLGSREMCTALSRPLDISLPPNRILRASAPFAVDYRVVYLRHNSPWQINFTIAFYTPLIHVGLCVPSACSASELATLMRLVATASFAAQDFYEMQPRVAYVKSLRLRAAFYERRSFSLMAAALLFTLAMTIGAVLLRWKAPPINCQRTDNNSAQAHAQRLDVNSMSYALNGFIKCFDIQSNCTQLFSVTAATDFRLIDGLRSLAAFAIVGFHVLHFMETTVGNKIAHYAYTERAGNLGVCVEVFYVISGFLRTYNFMRNRSQLELIRLNNWKENCKEYLKLVFQRLLRLLPLYLVAICVSDLVFAYLDDMSVFHVGHRLHDACARYWWRNLLFIQNFFDYEDMCLIWTWSLATEVQYFLLATLLLFLYARRPKWAQCATLLLLVANMLWTYHISADCRMNLASVAQHFTGIYTNSSVKVLPYIMGAMAAWWHLQRGVQKPPPLGATQQHCLWLGAAAIVAAGASAPLPDLVPDAQVAAIIVFGRLLFALSLCWLIVGSEMAPGRRWSLPLKAKVFRHLSRVCYAISLFNPPVIMCVFYLGNSSTHAQPFQLCIWFVGLALFVYLVALVSSLLFELPYSNWCSFWRQHGKRKAA